MNWVMHTYLLTFLPLLGCMGHEYKPMHKGAKETGIVWYSFNLTSLKERLITACTDKIKETIKHMSAITKKVLTFNLSFEWL